MTTRKCATNRSIEVYNGKPSLRVSAYCMQFSKGVVDGPNQLEHT